LLRIRLTRVGKRKQPAYRLVVADSRSPRDGSFLKIIGHYNPLTDPATLVVKEDEAVHWLEKGARPSETVAKLLTRIGVMERAGRPPVRYEGKSVPAAPKKEAKAATPAEPKAPPAKAAAEPEAETEAPTPEVEAPEVAEPEAAAAPAESEAAEPPAEPETAEASEEPAAEAQATEAEAPPEEGSQLEAKEDEAETEATNDEQPQEPAKNQE
jgi:small subunit ribosomal protein S16